MAVGVASVIAAGAGAASAGRAGGLTSAPSHAPIAGAEHPSAAPTGLGAPEFTSPQVTPFATQAPSGPRRFVAGYPALFMMPSMDTLRAMWTKAEPTVDTFGHPLLLGAGLTFGAQVIANTTEYLQGNFLPGDAAAYFLTDFKLLLGTFVMPALAMIARRFYHDMVPEPIRREQISLRILSAMMKLYGAAYLVGMATRFDGVSQHVDGNLYMQGLFAAGIGIPVLSLVAGLGFVGALLSNDPRPPSASADRWADSRAASIDRGVSTQLDEMQAQAAANLRGPVVLSGPPQVAPPPKPIEVAEGQGAAAIAQLLGIEEAGVNEAIYGIAALHPEGRQILVRCGTDESFRKSLVQALLECQRQGSGADVDKALRLVRQQGVDWGLEI